MSSIEKYTLRSGKTQYKVRFRDQDGKQHQKKGFEYKRDAVLFAATVETTVASGAWIDPNDGRVTVGHIYADWLAGLNHIKETTKATREVTWKTHVKPRWGDVEIGKIKPSQVRAWIGQMKANGAKVPTIENALGVLRMVLGVAVEDRLITSNPAAGVRAPRRQPKDKKFLTHQQVAALAEQCGSDGTIVLVLAYCGLRFGELAALRVGDVDFLRRRISVTRSVSEVRGKGMVWTTPKTYEARTVPVPTFIIEPLSRQAADRGHDDLLFGDGTPLRVNNWRKRVWAPAGKRCRAADKAFPALTIHDLRATAVSLALSAGASLKAVQALAGHRSGAVTADVYASLLPDDLAQVSDALERERAKACDPGVTPAVVE